MSVCDFCSVDQPRAAVATSLPSMGGLAGVHAVSAGAIVSVGSGAPMSTIRLTMPAATAQTRQRSPATISAPSALPQVPQVLKVMGTQPGSIPQIITLSSPRAVSGLIYFSYCFIDDVMVCYSNIFYSGSVYDRLPKTLLYPVSIIHNPNGGNQYDAIFHFSNMHQHSLFV